MQPPGSARAYKPVCCGLVPGMPAAFHRGGKPPVALAIGYARTLPPSGDPPRHHCLWFQLRANLTSFVLVAVNVHIQVPGPEALVLPVARAHLGSSVRIRARCA